MLAFTCDIDWAPEEVIADTLNIFEMFGVKCTMFSTHHSLELTKASRQLFEIGIHPNFHPLLRGGSNISYDDILDEILEIHPEAVGVRTHTMMQSIPLLQKFADKRMLYEANTFMPYQYGLKAFKLWNNLIRIPFNWEDDVHWAYGYSFEDAGMEIDTDELVIFDFHPIHIFLNTENKYRYNEAKNYMNDTKKLLDYRNSEVPGTRDLLMNLLKRCKEKELTTYRLKDIAYTCLAEGLL
ncbi:MAG TPA: hypothetical protein PKE39_09095 [Ignavibacteria bacterium]|nr:hypothetical protein [Ignavibacteria bacterium]HMQ99166.1 hypothetical protein [Ignavibacteria bacterium]